MYYAHTPPPKGWQSTLDLRQKQLVPVEDESTLEMRYPTYTPREIPASHFSVHAFVLSGQTPTPVGNLFYIDPKQITSSHEEALEDYIENLSKNPSDGSDGDVQEPRGLQESTVP